MTLPNIQPDSPFPTPSLVVTSPRSRVDETEEAHLQKTSAGEKLAMEMLHKEAPELTDCIWLCFAHSLSWTADSTGAYFFEHLGEKCIF